MDEVNTATSNKEEEDIYCELAFQEYGMYNAL
jgi:hypothetical protein